MPASGPSHKPDIDVHNALTWGLFPVSLLSLLKQNGLRRLSIPILAVSFM
jgi:hypothetical protein